ncbi:MAG: ATP-binding protein [Comamonas sp.]|nr:ATP-binding protein [Comamonas sp.]
MNLSRKKLPIGIQTFRHIREEGYYYVDKTAFVHKLVTGGKYYFLSRPRRFGKSLFLDTLAELFEGNEPLFRGLYCHDKWDWSVRYPVVRLSFGAGLLQEAQRLQAKIHDLLSVNEQRLGLSLPPGLDVPQRFSALLRQAEEKYGQRVVVLVDEYDKPILDNLTDSETSRQMRNGLRDLYSVIKDNDAHIQFAFLTGVSKFSKVSIFSGLNNLNDITVDADYSAICGYTDEDVDTVFAPEFAPELAGLERQQIRDWYNGYNWLGTAVYNPFDLLLLFDKRQFRPYWFETGTPTFLLEVLMQRGTFTPSLANLRCDDGLLNSFDVDYMATEALLWQTGYLTLRGQRLLGARSEYTLGYPNLEVKSTLNDALVKALSGNPSAASRAMGDLYDLLMANHLAGLQQHLHSLFASIPHDWYRNNPITQYEGYWASVFYSHFAALGLDIALEDVTNKGRIDMTVLFNGHIYLFEFKVVEVLEQSAKGKGKGKGKGKALAQLQARNYAEKYRARGEPIHLIGV